MDLLHELISFAARAAIVFLTIAASTAVVVALLRRSRLGSAPTGGLEVKRLDEFYQNLGLALKGGMAGSRGLFRRLRREQRASQKATGERPSVFVLDFDGDLLATATTGLREEVTAITEVARPQDEVVVRLESGGGAVPHYGLAAAQLGRLKERQLKVTVCIDRVAASGGYMMACVADHVVAAPFSIVGSIGVVAQVPNVRRFLKRNDIDVEELTAGEFKRTVSFFGEITDQGRAKLQGQLDETHLLFKQFVKQYRPSLDIDQVATGEYWMGTRARELGLVDELRTSDDYLLEKAKEANVFGVTYLGTSAWRARLFRGAAHFAERVLLRLWSRAEQLTLR